MGVEWEYNGNIMGFFEQFFIYGNTVFKSTCGNEHGSGWNAGEKHSFQFSSVT
jgi:hypothetical protein